MMRTRGLVLLVVIGVLGVLVVLGVAFVTMARLERKASSQRLNATKALLLARSGLEDAMARLTAGQDPEFGPSRYGGEDWDADGIQQADEAASRSTGPPLSTPMPAPWPRPCGPPSPACRGPGPRRGR